MSPKFRIFAGPNGSGKSTLFQYLKEHKNIHTEIYISADRIESELRIKKKIVFNAYRIKTNEDDFFSFVKQHGLSDKIKLNEPSKWFSLISGVLYVKQKGINSYTASFIAGYLIEKLMHSGQSFCFETVMSHKSKLDLFSKANFLGYKTYLYFIFTRNVELNIERIKLRVKDGGHDVPEKNIRSRFSRSLTLLFPALKKSDRAFIIDNTHNAFELIGEKINGRISWNKKDSVEFFNDYIIE